jgi:hypothetical protein
VGFPPRKIPIFLRAMKDDLAPTTLGISNIPCICRMVYAADHTFHWD